MIGEKEGPGGNICPVGVIVDGRPFEPAEPAPPTPEGCDPETVERLALSLPGVAREERRFAFFVERNGRRRPIAWEWLAPCRRGGPRVPQPGVLVVRTPTTAERDRLVAEAPERFSLDLHYSDYPAVLVHLDRVDQGELGRLITAAWRTQALMRPAARAQRRHPASQQPALPLSA